MRPWLVAASALVAVGALVGPAAPSSATSDVFRGQWASIDPGDGSSQTLTIQGSGTTGRYAVFVRDSEATRACGGGPANVVGSGAVDGDTLVWFFTVTCPGGGRPPINGLVGPGLLTYDADDGTLVDEFGAVWHRT